MINFRYRPDVDGLRAIAVGMVLLFHSNLGFSGGYVGVDVFFVISGFLITGLITKEHNAGGFNLLRFWERRIRRIIPAATAMVSVVLMLGSLLLLPNDYTELAQAAFSQQLLFSNVFFWQHSGYFDGAAEIKPLLHTWSLAVEEQFYLVYPFLLSSILLRAQHRTPLILGMLASGSLLLSVYGVAHFPSASFFLLPTRAWELLLGALICFLPNPTCLKEIHRNLIGGFSLVTILITGWVYSENTSFPGLNALAPCIATFLLIYIHSGPETLSSRLLSAPPLVLIGLMSYSLYLWHWPILSCLRYWRGIDLPTWLGVLGLFSTFILALLSWRYVETPMRKSRPNQSYLRPFVGAAVSIAGICSMACFIELRKGFPDRLPSQARKILESTETTFAVSRTVEEWERGEFPRLGKPDLRSPIVDLVVWGDSHAGILGELLNTLAEKHNLHGYLAAEAATVPLPKVYNNSSEPETQLRRTTAMMSWIHEHRPRHIFLIANWPLYGNTTRRYGIKTSMRVPQGSRAGALLLYHQMRELLDEFEMLGLTTWVVMRVPNQEIDPKKLLAASVILGSQTPKGISLTRYLEADGFTKQHLESITKEFSNAHVLDPQPHCFTSEGWSRIGNQSVSFYRDAGHLSAPGARELLTPLFEPIFRGIQDSRQRIPD